MNSPYQPGLHRFAVLTGACTVFLLLAGASVTSNDAGLAVPDWPLSYGSLMPPMVGGIFFEHGHRLVATAVGFLTIVLAVWLSRREPRRWVRRLGWTALAAVVAQGILGGITVKFFLPPAVSIAHATLAQIFFCIVVSLAVFTSRWWHTDPGKSHAAGQSSPALSDVETLRAWALATGAAVLVHLVLGAAFRHRVLGILPHALWAIIVAVLAYRSAARARSHRLNGAPALGRVGRLLQWVLSVQLVLGGVSLWARIAARNDPQPMPFVVWTTVAHVVGGALVLGAVVVLALCAHHVMLARPREGAAYAMESGAQKAAI
jgi:cytochrome c oxidase assembly protein subunit 15